jgi:2-dehydropantoate 2-reductase
LNVAVIGAGAVGAVLAAAATRPAPAGEEGGSVTVCVRTPVDSLVLETGPDSPFPAGPVAARLVSTPSALAGSPPADVVFVTVKATDSASVAPWLAVLCGPSTLVVVAQNGLGQQNRFAGALSPATTVVAALAYLAAERLGPGRVRHLSGHLLIVPEAAVATVSAAVPVMKVRGATDMVTASWKKLLGNLVANPITTLTMRRIGVMNDPGIPDLARGLLLEALAVGRAEGAAITEEDVDRVVVGTGQYGDATGSSMLYDRLAGLPLEHQWLTGEVVRRAGPHGIPVPLNSAVLALLDALDRGQRLGPRRAERRSGGAAERNRPGRGGAGGGRAGQVGRD